jgi:urea carboxylase
MLFNIWNLEQKNFFSAFSVPLWLVFMFKKILIANRGAIACRIARTLKKMGITPVAVYSAADAESLHVLSVSDSVHLGEGAAAKTYLSIDKILAAASESGAEAIHPGYGFLSESLEFASRCKEAGIVFIGPRPENIRDFGLKHTARELAQRSGVPLSPGSGLLADMPSALQAADGIGYPVMLKSTAGGGGIGMQLCANAGELTVAYDGVKRLSQNNFGDGGLFLEKYVDQARHIEVQIFGDGRGRVIALGERDCTLQRRNQKVVEETPAPGLCESVREMLCAAAVRLGASVKYESAGTVEFIYDRRTEEFYFLEVNTRLQVEHGVTEEVTGVDLVEWMVRQAAGEHGFLEEYVHKPAGVAVQVRVYAEDPGKNFQPAGGLLTHVGWPGGVRCDHWVESGLTVSPLYDPLLGKLIVHADTREAALTRLATALEQVRLDGIETNVKYLRQIVCDEGFIGARHTTRYLNSVRYAPRTIDVIQPGLQTTVQDWPGRTGYWNVGVPPSGPMDFYAHRMANRLLGNAECAAALEITLAGPSLKFNSATTIAITGADLQPRLNDVVVPLWQTLNLGAGDLLTFAGASAGGRCYLAVKGGLDVPDYLGSKSTFTLGRFGGHGGRALQVGDVLHLHADSNTPVMSCVLPETAQPLYPQHWRIDVMYGPYGAPDYFTAADIRMFFTTDWEVHYNSSRTGIRLIGPKPQWARQDGDEAGLHPSNIHDNAYAVGTVDFTGDMPVILAVDGPSLGGFVCPATIIGADLWKMGQLKAGDTVRFNPVTVAYADRKRRETDGAIAALQPLPETTGSSDQVDTSVADPVVLALPAGLHTPQVCYRQAGDRYLLLEYGPMVLDIRLRLRVHALMLQLQREPITGVIDLTPGIRSLQVHYDNTIITQRELLRQLQAVEMRLPKTDAMEVPTRIVHLPLAWDHAATRLAIEKYMQSVRADAPWCPSNIEFIRRINGLDSIDDVKSIVFNASYLVMGLGDVYLGAPVATPLDPRHRLVTTKYNPARTWTPENAVGIGGSYLCVYGMEGPGGYQFVGRTLQMWNRFRQTEDFTEGKPWLLRFFDQIRFYPVTEAELEQQRRDFISGRLKLKITQSVFRAADYARFLEENGTSIGAFKQQQQRAFEAERERWAASSIAEYIAEPLDAGALQAVVNVPPGHVLCESHLPGNCWSVAVKTGDAVAKGDVLLVIESMKMEIAIQAVTAGVVRQLLCKPGQAVTPGQALVMLEVC